MDKTRAVV